MSDCKLTVNTTPINLNLTVSQQDVKSNYNLTVSEKVTKLNLTASQDGNTVCLSTFAYIETQGSTGGNIDGGFPDSVYLPSQNVNGGLIE